MIKPTNYFNVLGWMITDLGLKGNELLVYAIIYGFSQDEENVFSGRRKYLADWLKVDVKSISRILNSLTDKGVIMKETKTINGVQFCDYWANPRMIPDYSNTKKDF